VSGSNLAKGIITSSVRRKLFGVAAPWWRTWNDYPNPMRDAILALLAIVIIAIVFWFLWPM
jgi:hypothetical protein